jgi:hypothetical protein
MLAIRSHVMDRLDEATYLPIQDAAKNVIEGELTDLCSNAELMFGYYHLSLAKIKNGHHKM